MVFTLGPPDFGATRQSDQTYACDNSRALNPQPPLSTFSLAAGNPTLKGSNDNINISSSVMDGTTNCMNKNNQYSKVTPIWLLLPVVGWTNV